MIVLKKILLFFCILLVFTLNVSAFETDYITPDNDFIVYSNDADRVAEILKIGKDTLKDSIENNNILYLAVNAKNTKQIQVSFKETDFTASVKNLSTLSADNINALLPDITGAENIKGEIVYKDKEKFVRTDIRTGKDENECILTQFFTITDGKMYTVSFYTDVKENVEYIDSAFVTTEYPQNTDEETPLSSTKIIIICATVLFGIACIFIIITIIKDMFFYKDTDENLEVSIEENT